MQDDVYKPPEASVARQTEPGEVELASRWRRLFGSLLDGLIVTLLVVPFMFGTGYWERVMEATAQVTEPYLWAVAAFLLYCALNAYTLHVRGQSLGKMLVGTQIVDHASHALLPLWKIILLRWLPISVLSNIPAVGVIVSIGNGLMIFRNDKRCGHDHIAGTIVINYVDPANLPRSVAV